MRKFTKICLITAAVLGCVGLSLCISALVLGVTWADVENTSVIWDHDAKKIVVSRGERKDFQESFTDVESLKLEIKAGDVRVEESDSDFVVVTGKGVSSGFQCTMEGKTLKIEDKNKNRLSLGSLGAGENESKITVEVPKGMEFKNMDLDVSMGNLEVVGFQTKTMGVTCGTGSATLEGDVMGESDFECGMGELIYQGGLGGNVSFECGMGSITANLTNSQEDFDYELTCGMGEVQVGDLSIGGIAGEQKISNKAGKLMEVDCGMGDVTVEFEQ